MHIYTTHRALGPNIKHKTRVCTKLENIFNTHNRNVQCCDGYCSANNCYMPIGRNASPAQKPSKNLCHTMVFYPKLLPSIEHMHTRERDVRRMWKRTRTTLTVMVAPKMRLCQTHAGKVLSQEPNTAAEEGRGASRRSWSPGPCHVFRIWWKCHTGDPLRVGCTRAREPHELLLSHFSCVSAFLARLAKLCVTHDISSTLTSTSGAIERERKRRCFWGRGCFVCEIMYVHTKSTLWIVTDTVDTGSLRRAPPSGWFGLEYSWLELYATRMAHEVTRRGARFVYTTHNTHRKKWIMYYTIPCTIQSPQICIYIYAIDVCLYINTQSRLLYTHKCLYNTAV